MGLDIGPDRSQNVDRQQAQTPAQTAQDPLEALSAQSSVPVEALALLRPAEVAGMEHLERMVTHYEQAGSLEPETLARLVEARDQIRAEVAGRVTIPDMLVARRGQGEGVPADDRASAARFSSPPDDIRDSSRNRENRQTSDFDGSRRANEDLDLSAATSRDGRLTVDRSRGTVSYEMNIYYNPIQWTGVNGERGLAIWSRACDITRAGIENVLRNNFHGMRVSARVNMVPSSNVNRDARRDEAGNSLSIERSVPGGEANVASVGNYNDISVAGANTVGLSVILHEIGHTLGLIDRYRGKVPPHMVSGSNELMGDIWGNGGSDLSDARLTNMVSTAFGRALKFSGLDKSNVSTFDGVVRLGSATAVRERNWVQNQPRPRQ